MRRLIALGALVLLAACMPDPLGRSADAVRSEKQTCDAEGGTWQPGGLTGAMMCFRETPDGGKSCSRSSDCSGVCLSDTRSCSAVRPLFGCFGMLTDDGEDVEICVD